MASAFSGSAIGPYSSAQEATATGLDADGNIGMTPNDVDGGEMPIGYSADVDSQAENQLAPGWKEAHDTSGKVYYFHMVTGATIWERPTLSLMASRQLT